MLFGQWRQLLGCSDDLPYLSVPRAANGGSRGWPYTAKVSMLANRSGRKYPLT
jgi:hypothetical protein